MKIDMKYNYFRYTLFRSSRCYFWCTVGARYERAPNFSCPVEAAIGKCSAEIGALLTFHKLKVT